MGWQPKHGVERKIESVLCMSQLNPSNPWEFGPWHRLIEMLVEGAWQNSKVSRSVVPQWLGGLSPFPPLASNPPQHPPHPTKLIRSSVKLFQHIQQEASKTSKQKGTGRKRERVISSTGSGLAVREDANINRVYPPLISRKMQMTFLRAVNLN
ncbi:hypothetical protein QQF64_033183 [Cirrhinus molitorella]|uniref:Uncharacterized protein n=1 Tax=Cirrhinus molitorella TaxID=172907 RepID=A0ABR3MTD7_9TELE